MDTIFTLWSEPPRSREYSLTAEHSLRLVWFAHLGGRGPHRRMLRRRYVHRRCLNKPVAGLGPPPLFGAGIFGSTAEAVVRSCDCGELLSPKGLRRAAGRWTGTAIWGGRRGAPKGGMGWAAEGGGFLAMIWFGLLTSPLADFACEDAWGRSACQGFCGGGARGGAGEGVAKLEARRGVSPGQGFGMSGGARRDSSRVGLGKMYIVRER
eukprot:1086864-Prorocentrum_minimum.AAC.7